MSLPKASAGHQSLLYLGCPVWASDSWNGRLFTSAARRRDWLAQYSAVFNTVEGNSTFYGLPSRETARRWVAETTEGFRFALKFPRSISHERLLLEADGPTKQFLEIVEILAEGNRLGPSFLQLSPTFDRQGWPDLQRYLQRLPRDFPYAVEVRHRDYFDNGEMEGRLNGVLTELGIDRVLLDSRPLFSAQPTTQCESISQNRKPRVPLRQTVTAGHPMVRLIGRDRVQQTLPWVDQWAKVVAQWLQAGLEPYFFAHTPDDLFAPDFARLFHNRLQHDAANLSSLPPWPGEQEAKQQSRQRRLF